eukprot:scaffold230636_cov32-Tisochrysis_lutea.AAC.3
MQLAKVLHRSGCGDHCGRGERCEYCRGTIYEATHTQRTVWRDERFMTYEQVQQRCHTTTHAVAGDDEFGTLMGTQGAEKARGGAIPKLSSAGGQLCRRAPRAEARRR